jgi:hypothetical protein
MTHEGTSNSMASELYALTRPMYVCIWENLCIVLLTRRTLLLYTAATATLRLVYTLKHKHKRQTSSWLKCYPLHRLVRWVNITHNETTRRCRMWGSQGGSPLKGNRRFGGTCSLHLQLCLLLIQPGFLFVFFFDPEDGGDTLLRNVISTNYTVLYPRRQKSTIQRPSPLHEAAALLYNLKAAQLVKKFLTFTEPIGPSTRSLKSNIEIVQRLSFVPFLAVESVSAVQLRALDRLKPGRWSGKLLLALASTVILGSESRGPHDHILLSDGSGSLQNLSPS